MTAGGAVRPERVGRPQVTRPEPVPVESVWAYLERTAALELVAAPRAGARSLDVGGWRCLLPCAERGFEAHAAVAPGLARSARGELARRGVAPERIRELRRRRLPFFNASVALITCLGGLPERRAERQLLLAEFGRLLMPGGTLIASLRQQRPLSTAADGTGFLSRPGSDPDTLCHDLTVHRFECERQGSAVCLSTARDLLSARRGEGAWARMDRLASLDRDMRRLFPERRGQVSLVVARRVAG